jgi:hypothetical protein
VLGAWQSGCTCWPTVLRCIPQVNDTQVTPWDSIGLLARQNANSISK